MMTTSAQIEVQHTDHALLAGLGMFGRQIGLFEALDEVRFPGRVYKRSPQRKLRELLAALAAGYRDLQDIDLAPDAIRSDPLVIAVWDAEGLAHYTNVSRGVRRADSITVSDLQMALERVSALFLANDVEETLATGSALRLEGDTTGLGTTAKMPGVEPGLIEGHLQPGFQMASVSLRTPVYRVMLGSAHFNGKKVSCQTLETLVQLAEQRIGRPRRRVELLYVRLEDLQQDKLHWRDKAQASQVRAEQYEERAWELHFLIEQAEAEIAQLEAEQADRGIRPHSQLSKARRRRQVYERWQASARRRQLQARQITERHLLRVAVLQEKTLVLRERITRYAGENRTNVQPLEIIFSLDGGFGTPDNVTLLTELGYDVATKAHGQTATPHLKREVGPATVWETVNGITQAMESQRAQFGHCPYPVRLILTRQQRGDQIRHSTLVVSPADAQWGRKRNQTRYRLGTAETVHFYNNRQDIEAGIKEFKGVFYLGHMRFFSPEAIQIQEQMITFLPNFIRWAIRYYFRPNAIYLPTRADRGLDQLKDAVRMAMRSRAEVQYGAEGCVLAFAPQGAFAGLVVDLRQPYVFQPMLPLFGTFSFCGAMSEN
jgi:hypothetical protein